MLQIQATGSKLKLQSSLQFHNPLTALTAGKWWVPSSPPELSWTCRWFTPLPVLPVQAKTYHNRT